jgi:hypothetical protein
MPTHLKLRRGPAFDACLSQPTLLKVVFYLIFFFYSSLLSVKTWLRLGTLGTEADQSVTTAEQPPRRGRLTHLAISTVFPESPAAHPAPLFPVIPVYHTLLFSELTSCSHSKLNAYMALRQKA